MANRTVTFEVPEESLAILDEIAANMEMEREETLRDAIKAYLADFTHLNAEVAQAEKSIESGNFETQDQIEARFEAHVRTAEAA